MGLVRSSLKRRDIRQSVNWGLSQRERTFLCEKSITKIFPLNEVIIIREMS